MRSNRPRIIIAASGSGAGKTTVTVGLLHTLHTCFQEIKAHLTDGLFVNQESLSLAAFKCGPDYIDPLFHQHILKIPSDSLDLFFQGEKGTRGLFLRRSEQADLSGIEGVMGYYDGMRMDAAQGSKYHIAALLQAPVILVVSARGKALSLAA